MEGKWGGDPVLSKAPLKGAQKKQVAYLGWSQCWKWPYLPEKEFALGICSGSSFIGSNVTSLWSHVKIYFLQISTLSFSWLSTGFLGCKSSDTLLVFNWVSCVSKSFLCLNLASIEQSQFLQGWPRTVLDTSQGSWKVVSPCVCVCVCVCARACVCVCVRAHAYACVWCSTHLEKLLLHLKGFWFSLLYPARKSSQGSSPCWNLRIISW